MWGKHQRRVDQLAAYLDQFTVGRRSPNGGEGTAGTITIQDHAKLVALQCELCSRIARLLREQQQLQQAWKEDKLQQAMNDALDALSEMWGVKL